MTILVDNCTNTDKYLLAEPALSFYIELGNKKILFDCGYSDILIQNAFKLKIDLREITDIVLSHGHNDHTGGLFYLKKLYQDSLDLGIKINIPIITAHPDIFSSKIDEIVGDVGCPLSETQLEKLFKLDVTKKPKWITSELVFLGEIPQENIQDCSCPDDSALVYKSSQGLVIITGCSHSGLKNIIKYAKKVTNIEKIYNIIGGFHLIDESEEEMKNLIEYLKPQNIKTLCPCHCTDLKAKILLSKVFPIEDICVGSYFNFL